MNLNSYFFKTQDKVFGEGYDVNNFTEFRIYRYANGAKNLPSKEDGIILTFVSILNMGTPVIAQIAITQSGALYSRIKWYTVEWSGWRVIS